MHFYYPNFQNDMRRILGQIFYREKSFFVLPQKKAFDEMKAKTFCREKGIGIGDTAQSIIRLQDNASDEKLQVIQTFDIANIIVSLQECTTLVITGKKAMEILLSVLSFKEPKI
jgi:G:T/U-mismatch repair DNA glycosylase